MEGYMLNGYTAVNCVSRSAHTGGVLLYLDGRLRHNVISNVTSGNNWFVACEVKSDKFSGVFGGVYHSPSGSDRDFIEFFETWIQDVVADDKINVIGGDFNIRWNEDGISRELKNVTEAIGLEQKVNEHTRVNSRSRTMIDLVFSNAENCVAKVVHDWKISDHETIAVQVPGTFRINIPDVGQVYTSWKKYSKTRLQTILRNKQSLPVPAVSLDEKALALSTALSSAVGELTEVRNKRCDLENTWYGPDLRRLKWERDEAYRRATQTGRTGNCGEWEQYNLLRNTYVRELKVAKDVAVQRELGRCSGDSKRLWNCLKTLIKPGGESRTDVIFEGDTTACSNQEAATRINQFFIESVKTIHDSIPTPNSVECEHPEQGNRFIEFRPITLEKLRKTVDSLKKCSGTDNVTKQVLVDAMDVIAGELLDIINISLMRGQFPEEWKKSTVIPIPKVPNSTRVEDRRPINMLPLYEKILETVVKEQVLEFIDDAGILIEEQSGFRKRHSCESALNLLLLKWKQSIEEGRIILAVFVDLKRAFETIDRGKLLEVLRRYGLGGRVLMWFSSYLERRMQATRYNGAVSPAAAVDLGVPQGSVLGPLLFILYMNDIKRTLTRANVNLFADDTVVYVTENTSEACYRLMNSELDKFAEWLKWKKLKLNVTKTKCMVVTNRRNDNYDGTVQIDGEVVERVEAIKYLGVMLDTKLTFNEHVDYTIRKAARKFGVLCRVNRFLSCDNKVMIYKTLIAPHFDYCSSVLFLASKQQRKRMQVLQSKVMRLILRCDRLTPRLLMLDSLQWMSVRQRVEYNTLIFIHKVTKGMAPQYMSDTVTYGRDVHRYNTRRAGDLRLPSYKKSCTQNSLFYKGYSLYNELPETARRTSNLREFKSICKTFVRQRPLE